MVMPKLTVTNYPEMLRKLSTILLFVTTGCVWIVRDRIVALDEALKFFDVLVPSTQLFKGFNVAFGTFAVAFAVAFFSESIKLHDKVSDLLRLRAHFDVRWILMPMALFSGVALQPTQVKKIPDHRKSLMGKVYYQYVSSSHGKAVIDPHTITQSLTTWSWYWACVEACVVLVLTAAVLAFTKFPLAALNLLIFALCLMGIARFYRAECAKYAESQIDQIMQDSIRRGSVAAAFNAL